MQAMIDQLFAADANTAMAATQQFDARGARSAADANAILEALAREAASKGGVYKPKHHLLAAIQSCESGEARAVFKENGTDAIIAAYPQLRKVELGVPGDVLGQERLQQVGLAVVAVQLGLVGGPLQHRAGNARPPPERLSHPRGGVTDRPRRASGPAGVRAPRSSRAVYSSGTCQSVKTWSADRPRDSSVLSSCRDRESLHSLDPGLVKRARP